MFAEWPLYLCLFIALWSAVIGGVFLAFSEFIMKALSHTDSRVGIESMQQINRDVMPTSFVAGILAIGALTMFFTVYAAATMADPVVTASAFATAVYLAMVLSMTLFGNVPMNNRLDAVSSTSTEGQVYWAHYLTRWTRFNHFRSLGCLLTAGLYLYIGLTLWAPIAA